MTDLAVRPSVAAVARSVGLDPATLTAAITPDDDPCFDDAICSQADPELFFPPPGGQTEPAQRLCQVCPAQPACLWLGLAVADTGIWGGVSYKQLTDLRQQLPTLGVDLPDRMHRSPERPDPSPDATTDPTVITISAPRSNTIDHDTLDQLLYPHLAALTSRWTRISRYTTPPAWATPGRHHSLGCDIQIIARTNAVDILARRT